MRRWLLASLLAVLGWHQAMPQLQPLLVLQGTGTYSPTIDISQSGTWIGVAPSLRVLSTDVGAKVWNLASNEVSAIPVNTSALLRFVPDTDSLAVLSVDSDITAYSPRRLDRWYWVPILRVFLPGRSFDVAPQFSAVAAVDTAGRALMARGLRIDILTPPSSRARVAFSPDGALLAVLSSYYVAGSEVSEVRLYRVSDLAVVWARQLPFAGRGLAFAPNGRYLAVAGAEGQIRLWDLSTNQEREVAARGVLVGALQFSPDSALLATGETYSASRFVRLWRTPDLSLHAELPVEDTPLDVAFHPTQNQLYVALWGGAIDTWTLQPPYQSQLFARYWRSFGFRRASRELWLSDGSYIYVYDGNGQLLQRFPAWVRDDPYSNDRVIAVSPDRQWYATRAGIWRLQNQQLVISGPVGTAAFSPDSSKVAIVRYPQTAVYDLRTAQLLWRAEGFLAQHLQFSANGARLMGVDLDPREARVYDANTGQLLWRSNSVPFDSVDDVLLSPDGALVAIRAFDVGTQERVKVYRVSDGSLVYRAPYALCDAFAFSPNSRYLVFSVQRAMVVCYDLQQDELLWEENYQAPLELSSESFSPDSQFVLLAQRNTPVMVGVQVGMPAVFTDSGHPFALRFARYSDDGARVELLYEDGTVALNRVPVPGDANRDECVNNADLLIVLFNFGTSFADADFNRDGVVNNDDLLIVLFNFGNGC